MALTNNKKICPFKEDPKLISKINYNLDDLNSRAKNCIFAQIENPDDDLIFAIIVKSFSDRQIKLEKKLLEFIIKRIERSYGKIYEFIYKVDELSLKKKKPVNIKTIKYAFLNKNQKNKKSRRLKVATKARCFR